MFERLSQWLLGAKSHVKSSGPAVQDWSDAELELILWCERQQSLGRIELPGRSGLFHSALLGMDVLDNQLLIDMPFPSPPIELLLPNNECKISFFKQQQLLQLVVRVEERLLFEGRSALLVKIIKRDFYTDRRAGERVVFNRSNWPLVRLQIPMADQLRARVINLSSGGALLNIFGRYDSSIPAKAKIAMKLELGDGDCIDVKSVIKAVSYYRRPCQHTQFRVQFSAIEKNEQRKLDLFLAFQQEQWAQAKAAEG